MEYHGHCLKINHLKLVYTYCLNQLVTNFVEKTFKLLFGYDQQVNYMNCVLSSCFFSSKHIFIEVSQLLCKRRVSHVNIQRNLIIKPIVCVEFVFILFQIIHDRIRSLTKSLRFPRSNSGL